MAASHWMSLALAQAERVRGRTSPNPPVGAVLVRDGAAIGQGATQPPGSAHAEVVALRETGERARGATLYVTLEPCCHHGRTPPCTDAIVAAGVARVVAALEDPNPLVAGRGIRRLREAGIEVELGDGADEAAPILAPFFTWVALGRPHVVAKWATSLDGKIATRTGDSRWISGPAARAWVHNLRDTVDAILVGSGTVLADDPMLTARRAPDDGYPARPARPGGPLRVILDRRGRLPTTARVLQAELAGGTLVVTSQDEESAFVREVRARGAEVLVLPGVADQGADSLEVAGALDGHGGTVQKADRLGAYEQSAVARGLVPRSIHGYGRGTSPRATEGRTARHPSQLRWTDARPSVGEDLDATLAELARRGVTSLLVEGGATVLGSFFDAGLVDHVAAFVAPLVVGGNGAPSPVGGAGAAMLRDAARLDRVTIQRLGDDVLVEGDVVRT